MPPILCSWMFEHALNMIGDNALDYAAFEYKINGFVGEYDASSTAEKRTYNKLGISMSRRIDKWFIKNGGKSGELIYITR